MRFRARKCRRAEARSQLLHGLDRTHDPHEERVPEIGWGDFSILGTGKPEVLALRYDWRNNSVLFVHNLSPIPTEVKFGAGAKVDGQLVNLLSNDHSTPNASGKHRILLEPYGYRWFRIGGLDYLLKRTDI